MSGPEDLNKTLAEGKTVLAKGRGQKARGPRASKDAETTPGGTTIVAKGRGRLIAGPRAETISVAPRGMDTFAWTRLPTRQPEDAGKSIRSLQGTIGDFLDRKGKNPEQIRIEWVSQVIAREGVLAELRPEDLRLAIMNRELDYLELGRDSLVEAEGRVLWLLEGKLALGAFASSVLGAEREAQQAFAAGQGDEVKWRNKHGPLTRIAERNLAWFVASDVIDVGDLQVLLGPRVPDDCALGVFALTRVRLVSVARSCLSAWEQKGPSLLPVRSGMDQARARLELGDDARCLIVDFYVRQGLSVAKTLRVIDLDRCTYCRECETACAQRYGAPRLDVFGKTLGALQFANTCRTCADQRCVEACRDDAIRFDESAGEVKIDEEKCIGCSLCQQACPYDALTMQDAEKGPFAEMMLERVEKARQDRRSTLEREREDEKDPHKRDQLGREIAKLQGPYQRPRQYPRVASKCDHCATFGGQQACIESCSKGALFEMAPETVFAEHQEQMLRRSGEIKGWPWGLASIGVLLLLLCMRYGLGWLNPYRLQLWTGLWGTALMAVAVLYSVVNRILKSPSQSLLRRLFGSLGAHVWSGTLGPIFVVLHLALSGGQEGVAAHIAWLTFWLMFIAVVTGLGARYFASGIVRGAATAELRMEEADREILALSSRHGVVHEADNLYETEIRRYETVIGQGGTLTEHGYGPGVAWRALSMLLGDELSRLGRARRWGDRLTRVGDPYERTQLARLLSRKAYLKRQAVLLPALRPLFSGLRGLHIPLTVVMSVAIGFHIYFSYFQAWRGR